MSVVRVAVPVLQGRRKFHFDKGKPWSILEHILLTALAQRDATAQDLAARADVPQRLIIEALIRLMRAGWVQMVQRASSVYFQTTRQGIIAAIADELPNVTRRMSRNMTFVIDQVAGCVFRTRELPYLHKHMVEERATREPIVWIERPQLLLLDEIRPLVEALFQDDEKFVAMDASGDRLADRWSLVTVRDGEVDGLTQRAPTALVSAIKAAAQLAPKPGTNAASASYRALRTSGLPPIVKPPVRNVSFSTSDLVLGGKDHRDVLVSSLRRARHRVIVHSTFIDDSRVKDLMDEFRTALRRGAVIDVMWGQDESVQSVRSTRDAVGRLRDKLRAAGLDRLRIHPFSTHSHCKMLIADDGTPARFTGYVGSCNWLCTSFESYEATVRLRDPVIVADAVDQLSELSRGSQGHWIGFTGELAALAAHLRRLKTPPGGSAQAAVILGAQHADLVREARDGAETRIFVTSHRFGVAARPAVLTPALAAVSQRGVRTNIFYGTTSGPMGGIELAGIALDASNGGVKIRPVRKPRLHAKVLAWDDDSLVISSQNWLSADPPDSSPRQEIGVWIRSTGVARTLIDRFEAARID
jgi:cardiolipin synthase